MTLKVRYLPFLTTFTQLTARLKNFLFNRLVVSLEPRVEEGLVECATLCVKSEVILLSRHYSQNEWTLNGLGLSIKRWKGFLLQLAY